jgi:hypothetical protein
MSPCDCKIADVHCHDAVIPIFTPLQDDQRRNFSIALIVVRNVQSHNGLYIDQNERLRTIKGSYFSTFYSLDIHRISSKKPPFIDKLGPFWQNNPKSCKKNDKNACPSPKPSLIFPASAPFEAYEG